MNTDTEPRKAAIVSSVSRRELSSLRNGESARR